MMRMRGVSTDASDGKIGDGEIVTILVAMCLNDSDDVIHIVI